MISKKVTVNLNSADELQLGTLVQLANMYESKLTIVSNNLSANCKSIMGIIAFNPSNGTQVEIKSDGIDENEALDALAKFLEGKND